MVSRALFDNLLCSIENKLLILSMKIINYIFCFIWEYTIMHKKAKFQKNEKNIVKITLQMRENSCLEVN